MVLTVSFLEIYNETVKDLLSQTERSLQIQENQAGTIHVPDLSEYAV